MLHEHFGGGGVNKGRPTFIIISLWDSHVDRETKIEVGMYQYQSGYSKVRDLLSV